MYAGTFPCIPTVVHTQYLQCPFCTFNSDVNLSFCAVLSQRSLVAQSVLFIIVGYETTASLLDFSSFLLAKHKDQQQRLRDEVRQLVEDHGSITYQGIMEAKLLEACLQGESLIFICV